MTITPHPDRAIRTFSTDGWKTDFSRHTIPYREIGNGGPPKDGIPAIDSPAFVTGAQAGAFLKDDEPVVALELNGEARAYPLQILVWHEIVNDTLGQQGVAVTYCPLCNTAIAFNRRFEDQTLDFGTTGNLRLSDLVMYDRQSESWWQQASGEAIVGRYAGRRLEFVPISIISFVDFKSAYPNGDVLSRSTGFNRPYGQNPYVGYDRLDSDPLFSVGRIDPRLPPKERVVSVTLADESVAYPFEVLEKRRAVNDSVATQGIVVFFKPGAKSVLDSDSTADARAVGAAAVFERQAGGTLLSFHAEEDHFVDDRTHTTWDITGRAIKGPLAGTRLQPVVHTTVFWFAWAAFKPDTRIYR